MSTALVGVLTFVAMLTAGLLLLKPLFTQYLYTYEVRVRPRRDPSGSGEVAVDEQDSAILKLCEFAGQIMMQAMPALADKRTLALLSAANYRTPVHLTRYMGVKALVVTFALAIGLMSVGSNPINMLLCVPVAVCGWILPNFFLGARVKKRQTAILNEMPTIIDLLVVCAQAGLGLLMSVDKVSKEIEDSCPIMAEELQQLIADVKVFAKSVPIALRELGERCSVDELINMAAALVAAEAKGADISYPLRQQGDALRDRLKRKKEEEAAKVPVKMVPVIMIFVMPLILAPMLGPAVVTIVNSLGPMLGK